MIRKIAADASAATLYAIEVSYGSEIPPVPGTWDAVRTDVVTGQRTLLYRSGVQSSGSGAGLIVDARAIFFAHDGDVLRVEQ